MDRLLEEYKGQIKFVYHFVAPHESAFKAAEAALCAGTQGKYWEYHRTVFEHQIELLMASEVDPLLEKYARGLDLNFDDFKSCLDSGKMGKIVEKEEELRKSRGVRFTPTIFIGSKKIEGLKEIEVYREAIEEILKSR